MDLPHDVETHDDRGWHRGVLMGSGFAHTDDPKQDAPEPGSPLCNVMGGDDGTTWELAPCGLADAAEKGWYRVP